MKKKVIISLVGIVIIIIIVSVGTTLHYREDEPEDTKITATVVEFTENTGSPVGYSYKARLSDGTVIYVAAKDKCKYKVGTTVVYEENEDTGTISVWERIPPPLPDINPATVQYDSRTGEQLKWLSGMVNCERSEWIRDQCRILYAKGEISKEESDAYGQYYKWVEAIIVNTRPSDLRGTPYVSIFDVPMIDVLRQAIEKQRDFDRIGS